MKILKCLLVCALFQSFAASAATITTALFSIDLPDQWGVEDNKSSIVLAAGKDLVGSHPSPFLSIQYCAVGAHATRPDVHPCDKPCSEASLHEMLGENPQGIVLPPVTRRQRPDGGIELSMVTARSENENGRLALACSASAQLYIWFMSSGTAKETDTLFANILASLKWK